MKTFKINANAIISVAEVSRFNVEANSVEEAIAKVQGYYKGERNADVGVIDTDYHFDSSELIEGTTLYIEDTESGVSMESEVE